MLIRRRIHAFTLILAAGSLGACTNARVGDGDDGVGVAPDSGGGGNAGSPDAGGGGGGDDPDGGEGGAPDAAPQAISLTQSDSLDIVGDNSVACGGENDISANSYYRVFDLAALGVTGSFRVDKVTFGVQESFSEDGGGHQVAVKIHTLEGGLQVNNLTELSSTNTVIQELAADPPGEIGGRLHEVAIDQEAQEVPAGSIMVVEVGHGALPEGEFLLMGSNRANQTGPTFVRSPVCGQGEPTDIDTVEDVNGDLIVMHWVLVVEGTTGG